jgi:hypothetical protein
LILSYLLEKAEAETAVLECACPARLANSTQLRYRCYAQATSIPVSYHLQTCRLLLLSHLATPPLHRSMTIAEAITPSQSQHIQTWSPRRAPLALRSPSPAGRALNGGTSWVQPTSPMHASHAVAKPLSHQNPSPDLHPNRCKSRRCRCYELRLMALTVARWLTTRRGLVSRECECHDGSARSN